MAGFATKKGKAYANPNGSSENTVIAKADRNASFEPIENGVCSVSDSTKVRFASGNLEYDGFYRFAAHQYNYGGYFGWGTVSNPTLTGTNYLAYQTFDDWGSHIGVAGARCHTMSGDTWRGKGWTQPTKGVRRPYAVCMV